MARRFAARAARAMWRARPRAAAPLGGRCPSQVRTDRLARGPSTRRQAGQRGPRAAGPQKPSPAGSSGE
eukprot:6054934-Prymnesium_polylepis.2